MTYSKDEAELLPSNLESNKIPREVSPAMEKLARFIIAMFRAVTILVPMIIMSFHKFANDYALAATTGYTAVLMVFVGLTT